MDLRIKNQFKLKTNRKLSGLALSVSLSITCTAQADISYTDLVDPNQNAARDGTYVTGINDNGQITGWLDSPSGGFATDGFVYNGGTYTNFANPDPQSTGYNFTNGINDNGQVTAFYYSYTGSHENTNTYLYSSGTYTPVSSLPSTTEIANQLGGVSPNNVIIGGITSSGWEYGSYNNTTFIYDANQPNSFTQLNLNDVYLNGINDQGTVVGESYNNATHQFDQFTYNSSTGVLTPIIDPNAAPGMTTVFGINNNGDVVGDFSDKYGNSFGFLEHDGMYYTLQDPNAGATNGTRVIGINDNGQIAGVYWDSNNLGHSFVANYDFNTAQNNGSSFPIQAATLVDQNGNSDGEIVIPSQSPASVSLQIDSPSSSLNNFDLCNPSTGNSLPCGEGSSYWNINYDNNNHSALPNGALATVTLDISTQLSSSPEFQYLSSNGQIGIWHFDENTGSWVWIGGQFGFDRSNGDRTITFQTPSFSPFELGFNPSTYVPVLPATVPLPNTLSLFVSAVIGFVVSRRERIKCNDIKNDNTAVKPAQSFLSVDVTVS